MGKSDEQGMTIDQGARWLEIQRLSDAVARKDGAPTELESEASIGGPGWVPADFARRLERDLADSEKIGNDLAHERAEAYQMARDYGNHNDQLIEALERYQSLFFGRFGNLEHMSSDEFRAAHLRAYEFAKQVLSGAVRNEKVKYKLVYNKETKRIDKIRNYDGLCVESFDPPEEA